MTRPLTPRFPRPWRPRPLLPLLTVVGLAVSIVSSAGVGLRTAARDAGATVAPVAATSHSVQMANFAFTPQVLTVTAGDSITWTNQDEAPHTVTTTSGPQAINSPMLSKGQSFTFPFTVPGT
jgi:plastocyanin